MASRAMFGAAAAAVLVVPAATPLRATSDRLEQPAVEVADRWQQREHERRPNTNLAARPADVGADRAIEAPAAFDAPPAPTAAPPPALGAGVAKAGGTWAAVVGINDYPGTRSDLRVAVADADEVDSALAVYGVPAERRLVLHDTQASAAVIERSLQWLVDHAAADATVVFFYAGHVRKLAAGTEAIVAADGNLVRDSTVARILRPLTARAWITIAACYGGGFIEVLAPNRILTAAADANHLAYENPSMGRSYLVDYMVRQAMLDWNAASSVERSFAWAADRLRAEHPDRVPVQYDNVAGDLELGPAPPPRPPIQPDPPPAAPDPEPSPAPSPSDDPDDDNCLITLGTIAGCPDE